MFPSLPWYPDGRTLSARGEVEGHVILEERGTGGFGYDSIFVPLGYDITFGEFTSEDKNRISHRRNALRKKLQELLRREEENERSTAEDAIIGHQTV